MLILLFLVWFGVVFVRSGLYEDGIFRFNITLPENFPDGEHPVKVTQTIVQNNFMQQVCFRKSFFNLKFVIL